MNEIKVKPSEFLKHDPQAGDIYVNLRTNEFYMIVRSTHQGDFINVNLRTGEFDTRVDDVNDLVVGLSFYGRNCEITINGD